MFEAENRSPLPLPMRIGRFVLTGVNQVYRNGRTVAESRQLTAVFGRCVILDARFNHSRMGVEYIALCDEFEEVDGPGAAAHISAVPEYEWLVEFGDYCPQTDRPLRCTATPHRVGTPYPNAPARVHNVEDEHAAAAIARGVARATGEGPAAGYRYGGML